MASMENHLSSRVTIPVLSLSLPSTWRQTLMTLARPLKDKVNCPELPHQSTSNCCRTRMAGDRMSLCWNKFEETAASAFRYLGDTGDFSDVTLASEDGKQVRRNSLEKVFGWDNLSEDGKQVTNSVEKVFWLTELRRGLIQHDPQVKAHRAVLSSCSPVLR